MCFVESQITIGDAASNGSTYSAYTATNVGTLLRAEKPSTLTVELAYAGYTAFWARHEGFVALATDPTP